MCLYLRIFTEENGKKTMQMHIFNRKSADIPGLRPISALSIASYFRFLPDNPCVRKEPFLRPACRRLFSGACLKMF